MLRKDEDALICDLAETYHIYDYRSLPLRTVAILSAGLRENSRIKISMANLKYPLDTLMQAAIIDGINMGNWIQCKAYGEVHETPQSVLGKLLGRESDNGKEEMLFASVEDYEKAREEILKRR